MYCAQWAGMTVTWLTANLKFRCVCVCVCVCVSVCVCVCVCLISQSSRDEYGKGAGEGRRLRLWGSGREVMAPSCGQSWLSLPRSWRGLWWCWRRWRGALCTPCYLLEALLVPRLAVDTVGGDLPPIRDILADLGPVAVPLAPLAVGLGCRREAHLVLL